jgi:MFS superfamily sulfate permease-like transporter
MDKKNKGFLENLSADLPAALVVALVALPLCLGIASGSNAPYFSGIIAGVVGGIVVGAISGSPLSVSGPAAGLTSIVASAIAEVPAFEAFLLSVVIAGFIQLFLGFVKAGVIGDFVPSSVIKGMLAAIGIILIMKQLPHLVGYDADLKVMNHLFSLMDKTLSQNYCMPSDTYLRLPCLLGLQQLGYS